MFELPAASPRSLRKLEATIYVTYNWPCTNKTNSTVKSPHSSWWRLPFLRPLEIQMNSDFTPDTKNITPAPTVADLPSFAPISIPNFRWGDLGGEVFACTIDSSYDEIVHWRQNPFKVPSEKAGKAFIQEITQMFRDYADGSALESVALKAAMVMPALLLQKPHPRSKAKDHTIHLERHLQQWMDGDVEGLMKEGHTIQHWLTKQQHRPVQQTAC